mmetsp:Transcript_22794/g.53806  ORF Transcript_22794/g.53806 Transcript_22794/m.53806 type:complete len:2494 (+) Transcript_22794:244-7725(+)
MSSNPQEYSDASVSGASSESADTEVKEPEILETGDANEVDVTITLPQEKQQPQREPSDDDDDDADDENVLRDASSKTKALAIASPRPPLPPRKEHDKPKHAAIMGPMREQAQKVADPQKRGTPGTKEATDDANNRSLSSLGSIGSPPLPSLHDDDQQKLAEIMQRRRSLSDGIPLELLEKEEKPTTATSDTMAEPLAPTKTATTALTNFFEGTSAPLHGSLTEFSVPDFTEPESNPKPGAAAAKSDGAEKTDLLGHHASFSEFSDPGFAEPPTESQSAQEEEEEEDPSPSEPLTTDAAPAPAGEGSFTGVSEADFAEPPNEMTKDAPTTDNATNRTEAKSGDSSADIVSPPVPAESSESVEAGNESSDHDNEDDDGDVSANSSLPMEDIVQEALRNGADDDDDDRSSNEEACEACGFEAALVPDGMMKREKDGRTVLYCNEDCMKWDLGGSRKEIQRRNSKRSLMNFNDSEASGIQSVSSGPTLGSASMGMGEVFAAPSTNTNSGSSSTLDSGRDPALVANLWQNERNTPASSLAHPIELVPRKDRKSNNLSQFFENQQPQTQTNQHPYHPQPAAPVVAITRISRDSDHDTSGESSISASFDSQHSKPRMVASADGTTLLSSQHSGSSYDEDKIMEDLLVSMEKEEKMNDAASFAEDEGDVQNEQERHNEPSGHQLPSSLVPEMAAAVGNPSTDADEESLDIMDPQDSEDTDSMLRSIIEEASEISGDEPDKEGSWRSRDEMYDNQQTDASLLDATPNHPRPDPSANDESSGHVYEVVDVVEYSTNTDGQSLAADGDTAENVVMAQSEFAKQKRNIGKRPPAVKSLEQPRGGNPTLPAHMAASAAGGTPDAGKSGRGDSSVASNDFGSVLEEGDEESGASNHLENNKGDDDTEGSEGRGAETGAANSKDSNSESSNSGSDTENQESFAVDTGHNTNMLSITEASEGGDSFAEADDETLPKTALKATQSSASHDTIMSLASHFVSDSDGEKRPGLRSDGSKHSLLDLPSVHNSDSGDSEETPEEGKVETEEADDDSIDDVKDLSVHVRSTQGRRRSSNGHNGSSGKLSSYSSFNESGGELFDLDDAQSVRSNSFANKMALKDFRQAYTCEESVTSTNSRSLKNFHQVYHSDANSTVGEATTGSRSNSGSGSIEGSKNSLSRTIGDLHEELEELNSRNSKTSHNTTEDDSQQSGQQSNYSKKSSASKNSKQSLQSAGNRSIVTAPEGSTLQLNSANSGTDGRPSHHRSSSLTRTTALRMSLNKALRDYETLYGEEAAGAAFQQLAQAVLTGDGDDDEPVTPTRSVATAPVSRPSDFAPPPLDDDSSRNGDDNENGSSATTPSRRQARKNSLESIASLKSAQSAPITRGVARDKSNTSLSSWALPTDYSVFSIPAMTPSQSTSTSPEASDESAQGRTEQVSNSSGPNISERMSQLREEAQKMKDNGQMSPMGSQHDYRHMAMPARDDDSSEEEDIIQQLKNSDHGGEVKSAPSSMPVVAMHVMNTEPDATERARSEDTRDVETENASPHRPQSQSDAGTLSLTSSSGAVDSGPRYLQYRSLLSKGADAIASAARMLNFSSSTEEDMPVAGGSGSTSPVTSGSPTSHSEDDVYQQRGDVGDATLLEADAATLGQDFRLNLSSASSTSSHDTNPRYLRYRSLLAHNMTQDKEDGEGPPDALGIAYPTSSAVKLSDDSPDRVSKTSMTEAETPETPRYLQYRTTLAQKINVSTEESTGDNDGTRNLDKDEREVADLELKLSSLEAQLTSYLSKGGHTPGSEDSGDTTLDERLEAYLANDGPIETKYHSAKNTKGKSSRRDSWIGMGMDFSSSADSASSVHSDSSPAPRLPAHLTKASKSKVKTSVALGTASPYLQFVSSQDSDYSRSPKDGNSVDKLVDIEMGEAPAEQPLTPSEKKLGKKFHNNRRCMWYSGFIALLVCLPLAISFAFLFREEEDSGVVSLSIVEDTPVPTASPTVAPSATAPVMAPPATTSPVEGVSTTSAPESAPTSAPVAASTTTPTRAPIDTSTSPSSTPSATPSAPPSSIPTVTPTTSIAPSTSPTDGQDFLDLELLNLLGGASADNGRALVARDSPQNQAYFWLVGTNYTALTDERKIQRYALVTLYYSTAGESWNGRGGWLSEDDECNWSFAETPCNPSGVVVTLDLAFNHLQGEIPPEIAMLTELTSITLNGDGVESKITGMLPDELALLTKIQGFSASNNDLYGPIPSGLNWPNATTFDLSSNRLSDRIPNDIGLLVSLQTLNLGNNRLSGDLTDALGGLTMLKQLDLLNNTIEGPVPASIGNLVQLESMDISYNSFTSLPSSMGNLVNLENLNAQVNDLSGMLFDNWSSLDKLETLDLHGNELEGPIPASLGGLAVIQILDLSHNMFSESIPVELGDLGTLFHLFLNSNKLSGNIPAALEGLRVVTILRVDDNELEGAVPTELCDTLEDNQVPRFYSDCDVLGGLGKIQCPLTTCCTHCCNGGDCECVFKGSLSYLCL